MNNRELIVKLIFLVFLIILVFLTSFRTGEKAYYLQNSISTETEGIGNVARWNFNARIIYENREVLDVKN